MRFQSLTLFLWPGLLMAQNEITITDPLESGYVSGNYEVEWSIAWSDPIATTQVLLDGEVVFESNGNPGSGMIDFGNTSDHVLQVVMTDQLGNALQSRQVRTRAIRFDFAETSRLVLLTAVVRSRSNKVLANLDRSDFKVFEDGNPIEISSFQNQEVPLDLVLLLDTSSSLRSAMGALHQAANAFVSGLKESDSVALIQFHNEPILIQSFTNDKKLLRSKIENLEPYGETALFDAMEQGLDLLKSRKRGRRAMVLFTDGRDSKYERPEQLASHFRLAISRAQKQEVSLFTMGLGDKLHRDALEIMARESGGRFYAVAASSDLEKAFTEVLTDLRSQYLLGVIPQSDQRGFHPIQVEVKKRGAKVFARQGYFLNEE